LKKRIVLTFEVFETSKVLFEHVPGKTFGDQETPKVITFEVFETSKVFS